MKSRLTATGLAAAIVALAAAAPQGFAASQTIILAQAGDEAATAEAQTILADAANLSSLSEDDLKSRIKSARQLIKNKGVPDEVRGQLKDFVEAARKELITRQAQQKQEEQPAQQEAQPEQQTQEPAQQEAQPEQQTQKPAQQQEAQPAEQPAAPEVDAKAMAQAEAILNDAGNIASLSDKDLRARERAASRLLKRGGLPDDVTAGLQSFVGAVQQELQTREAGAKQPEQPATEQAQPQQEAAPPAASDTAQPAPTLEPAQEPAEAAPAQVDERNVGQANKLLADQRPLSEISDGELRKRVDAARKILKRGNLPTDVRDQLRSLIETSRAEIIARESPQQEPSQQQAAPVEKAPEPPPSTAENRAVENPDVSPEAEAQAKKLLAENASVEKLNDEQLRARLERFRDVLETGNLSRETERDLRDRLKAERQILRTRVATREMEQQASQQGGQQGGFNNGPVEIRQFNERPSRREMDFVVKDRRRLRELSEFELRRRILVYRELMRDERYSDQQLVYIRGELDKARRELRRRFEEDKLARADDFKRRRQKNDLDIDVNIVLQPEGGRPRPPVIWAAEEDEEEIERQLVARPIRRLPRQYPREVIFEEPETVLTQPEVRDALPGVEVDTINFGFNEAFVREEEVGNLESIATTIEEVVAAHPEEVFMIEGHTDAVGSDSYNLGLSRQRAEGVKKILLEFYNIGEDNLVAVGLGERYLKIPTPEPEQENRRVTVRRATPLISGYEEDEE